MTQNEHDIWTSYFNKVIDFLNATDLSKLADEDALQEAFCEYMNANYKETIREVEIPALKEIDGLGDETWEIDESTKHIPHEYIPCELKFHGINMEDRDFAPEVNADSEELQTIVRQFSDVHVAMSMFVTKDSGDFNGCQPIGGVIRDSVTKNGKTFYYRIACIAKSNIGDNDYRIKIFEKDYKYYYDRKKNN